MNPHLRTALRFRTYIGVLGGEPIPFRHGSHREWALDLQRQHERLRRSVDAEVAKAAKASARELIRRRGYQRAAEEATPVQIAMCDAKVARGLGSAGHEIATTIALTNDLIPEAERKARRLAELQCRRKLRHPNYWSAVQHALHLGRDVRTYACPLCEGVHCGNPPESDLTRQYRRARKRLQAIERRLVALDQEWLALACEKKALVRQVGQPDELALMLGEMAGYLRRLPKIARVWIGSDCRRRQTGGGLPRSE